MKNLNIIFDTKIIVAFNVSLSTWSSSTSPPYQTSFLNFQHIRFNSVTNPVQRQCMKILSKRIFNGIAHVLQTRQHVPVNTRDRYRTPSVVHKHQWQDRYVDQNHRPKMQHKRKRNRGFQDAFTSTNLILKTLNVFIHCTKQKTHGCVTGTCRGHATCQLFHAIIWHVSTGFQH